MKNTPTISVGALWCIIVALVVMFTAHSQAEVDFTKEGAGTIYQVEKVLSHYTDKSDGYVKYVVTCRTWQAETCKWSSKTVLINKYPTSEKPFKGQIAWTVYLYGQTEFWMTYDRNCSDVASKNLAGSVPQKPAKQRGFYSRYVMDKIQHREEGIREKKWKIFPPKGLSAQLKNMQP